MPQEFDGFSPTETDPFDAKGNSSVTLSFGEKGEPNPEHTDDGASDNDSSLHVDPVEAPKSVKKVRSKKPLPVNTLVIGGVVLVCVAWFGYDALTASHPAVTPVRRLPIDGKERGYRRCSCGNVGYASTVAECRNACSCWYDGNGGPFVFSGVGNDGFFTLCIFRSELFGFG